VPSWKNATRSTSGVLRPDEIEERTRLRREHAVSAELTPYVERYWTVRWELEGMSAYRAEVLSDPAVNVSVEQGSYPRFGVELPAALVHGVVTRRFSVDLRGTGAVAAAKFRPGGFTAFAGVRPARDTVALLTDQLALDAATLTAAVLREPDDDARTAILDAALRPLARDPADAYLELLAVLDRMRSERSLVRVDQVAADCAISLRSLQRLFTTYVGVGAKSVLGRYRLQDAVASIDSGEVDQLAELAVELGWFDQAHFSRDFRAVVGMTPSAYLNRARAGGAGAQARA
jgi:AraC-like DNA-binding protein